jgi:hypothetical protein
LIDVIASGSVVVSKGLKAGELKAAFLESLLEAGGISDSAKSSNSVFVERHQWLPRAEGTPQLSRLVAHLAHHSIRRDPVDSPSYFDEF